MRKRILSALVLLIATMVYSPLPLSAQGDCVWVPLIQNGEATGLSSYVQSSRSSTVPDCPRATATIVPTAVPTETATAEPTGTATIEPTMVPTATATIEPTATATMEPTNTPTATATIEPTATATMEPTATVEPTNTPTATATATTEPTPTETAEPTNTPIIAIYDFTVVCLPILDVPGLGALYTVSVVNDSINVTGDATLDLLYGLGLTSQLIDLDLDLIVLPSLFVTDEDTILYEILVDGDIVGSGTCHDSAP